MQTLTTGYTGSKTACERELLRVAREWRNMGKGYTARKLYRITGICPHTRSPIVADDMFGYELKVKGQYKATIGFKGERYA